MRGPKTTMLMVLREIAYNNELREEIGLTLAEVQLADRWVNAMPAWQEDLRP